MCFEDCVFIVSGRVKDFVVSDLVLIDWLKVSSLGEDLL